MSSGDAGRVRAAFVLDQRSAAGEEAAGVVRDVAGIGGYDAAAVGDRPVARLLFARLLLDLGERRVARCEHVAGAYLGLVWWVPDAGLLCAPCVTTRAVSTPVESCDACRQPRGGPLVRLALTAGPVVLAGWVCVACVAREEGGPSAENIRDGVAAYAGEMNRLLGGGVGG